MFWSIHYSWEQSYSYSVSVWQREKHCWVHFCAVLYRAAGFCGLYTCSVLLPWLTRPNFTTTLAPQHHVVLLFRTCTSSSHFQLSCPFSSCSNIALIWLLGAKYIIAKLKYLPFGSSEDTSEDSQFWKQSYLKTSLKTVTSSDIHFFRQMLLQVVTSKRVIYENSHSWRQSLLKTVSYSFKLLPLNTSCCSSFTPEDS